MVLTIAQNTDKFDFTFVTKYNWQTWGRDVHNRSFLINEEETFKLEITYE